jgi:hypothetical protein
MHDAPIPPSLQGPVTLQITTATLRALSVMLLWMCAASLAAAQELTLYDDGLQNGFEDYSYGGGSNFASTTTVHAGTRSVSFAGNNFNAVSFAHATLDFSTAQYPAVRFWVHGGATGGQLLRIYLQLDGRIVAQAPLGAYIAGGAIAAGAWREATVDFGKAPLSYAGSFDRIDLQSDAGGAQPVLYVDDVSLVSGGLPAVNTMQIEHGVTVAGMVSDRFTWRDGANQPRVAVLAHNDGQAGPAAADGYPNRGGALREFRYQMPNDTTRVLGVTTYGNGGYGGFGYVVSHRGDAAAGCACDDSPLGYAFSGGFSRVFEGRHHAVFRFTQLYPRYSSTTANPPNTRYNVPVTIDWVFATGRDHPLWAVTWDLSGVPVNALADDSRAPYGELNIDGQGFLDVDGVAWGDRYKFTTTTSPVTLDSAWTWSLANVVPWVKLWITSTDATMGIVLTQPLAQQDAGAGRNPFYHDIRPYWGRVSGDVIAGAAPYRMPWQDSWPYQANSFSIGRSPNSSNNARLTWGTQYGFLGQESYTTGNGLVASAPGWPRKSYSTHVVIGPHSASPIEAQVAQIETLQSLALGTAVGSVATRGPAGVNRADSITYAPAGYNHVYGALAFSASGNALDANIGVGTGTLKKPLIIVSDYAAGLPTVKLAGVALAADVDYFASLRPGANELWITLNRDLTGPTNRLEVLAPAPVTYDKTLYFPRLATSDGTAGAGLDASEYTGVALTNLSGAAATVRMTAYDGGGAVITGSGIGNPYVGTLLPRAQLAAVETQLFGAGLATRRAAGWMKLESTATDLAAFFLSFSGTLSVLDGAVATASTMTAWVLPELEGLAQGFTTVHVANPGTATAAVTLELVDAEGVTRASAARSIAPSGALIEGVASLFPGVTATEAMYVRGRSTAGVAAYEHLGRSGIYVQGLNGQDLSGGARASYSPQYVVGPGWRTALSVVNLEDAPTTLTLRFIDDQGVMQGERAALLAGRGKLAVVAQDFFGVFDPNRLVQGYVLVTSDRTRVSGSVLFGDAGRAAFQAALPLAAGLQTAAVFSQVASDAVYYTGLALLNPGDAEGTFVVDVYDRDGLLVGTRTAALPAKRRVSRLLTQLVDGLPSMSSGYFRVTSTVGMAAFALFGTTSGSVLAAVPPQ